MNIHNLEFCTCADGQNSGRFLARDIVRLVESGLKPTSISRIAMNRCRLVCKTIGKRLGENLRATFNLLLNNFIIQRLPMVTDEDNTLG